MNKIEEMKKLYQETNKELCDLIGDRTIDLIEDYLYDENTIIYWIGADQYNVKSVCVNSIGADEKKFLAFNVFLVTTDTEGNIMTYPETHYFSDIPCDTAIYLLEKIYKMVNGADANEN